MQNSKVVVYGFTDNLPVVSALQRAPALPTISVCRLAGRNPPSGAERHAAGPGAEPPIEIVLEGPGA